MTSKKLLSPNEKLNKVVQLSEEAIVAYKAAESWEEGYRKDKESFEMLLKMETRLERKLRRYFRELGERADSFVNWFQYQNELTSRRTAFEVFVDLIDDIFEDEYYILLNILVDEVAAGMTAGVTAEQNLSRFFVAPEKIATVIERTARQYSAELVTGLNQTTRQRIRDSIATSIELGEDVNSAAFRLGTIINDKKRATTIARTESVKSYSKGVIEFGKESGAKVKIWKAVQLGACPICAPLDGQEVPLNKNFATGIGPLESAPAHPNCRCRTVLDY